jgi:hypothetical protein
VARRQLLTDEERQALLGDVNMRLLRHPFTEVVDPAICADVSYEPHLLPSVCRATIKVRIPDNQDENVSKARACGRATPSLQLRPWKKSACAPPEGQRIVW